MAESASSLAENNKYWINAMTSMMNLRSFKHMLDGLLTGSEVREGLDLEWCLGTS